MPIVAVMVPLGLHHAHTTGSVTAPQGEGEPGYGEVAAVGADELLLLPLPFKKEVYDKVGFEEQFYILAKSLDGNISSITLDATEFEADPDTGAPILRLRVTSTALPGLVEIWLESHHSAGR